MAASVWLLLLWPLLLWPLGLIVSISLFSLAMRWNFVLIVEINSAADCRDSPGAFTAVNTVVPEGEGTGDAPLAPPPPNPPHAP